MSFIVSILLWLIALAIISGVINLFATAKRTRRTVREVAADWFQRMTG